MCLKNTNNSYGIVAKTLHWLMFVLIASLLALGFVMEDMQNSPDKFRLIGLHKSIGIAVLFLAVIRMAWKLANVSPVLPDHMRRLEKFLAHAGHGLLYVLMLVLPMSGWVMSSAAGFPVSVFGWVVLPNLVPPDAELKKQMVELHEMLAWVLIGVVTLHVLAAFLHHFYYKDNVLRRMLPWKDSTHA